MPARRWPAGGYLYLGVLSGRKRQPQNVSRAALPRVGEIPSAGERAACPESHDLESAGQHHDEHDGKQPGCCGVPGERLPARARHSGAVCAEQVVAHSTAAAKLEAARVHNRGRHRSEGDNEAGQQSRRRTEEKLELVLASGQGESLSPRACRNATGRGLRPGIGLFGNRRDLASDPQDKRARNRDANEQQENAPCMSGVRLTARRGHDMLLRPGDVIADAAFADTHHACGVDRRTGRRLQERENGRAHDCRGRDSDLAGGPSPNPLQVGRGHPSHRDPDRLSSPLAAPSKNTERSRSGRPSSSATRPSNRISPFSMK